VTEASTARALRFAGRDQLLSDISDVCAEMAGDRIEVDILARSNRHHTTDDNRFVRFRRLGIWEKILNSFAGCGRFRN
jgi:hypothetical protein